MPQQVIIGDDIICIDYIPEKLIKTSIYKGASRITIYEGGMGEIRDLLYKNEILIARTYEGWYFSRDKGHNWLSEDEYKRINPDFFKKPDYEYQFMSTLLQELITENPNLINHSDQPLEEWLLHVESMFVELLEIENLEEEEILFERLFQIISQNEMKDFLFIYPESQKKKILEYLFKLHANVEIPRKRILLKKIVNQSCFMQDSDLSDLYSFEKRMHLFKIQYDVKNLIICDLFSFFRQDRSPEFVESTMKLLLDTSYHLQWRIILFLNKSNLTDFNEVNIRGVFRNSLIDRYKINLNLPSENTNVITIKDVV